MSLLKAFSQKDYGFGRPWNGLPFNDPILDASNPGPISLDPSVPGNASAVFNSVFSLRGGSYEKFIYNGHLSCIKAYRKCSPLSTVINRKAQAHINGNTRIMNSKNSLSISPAAKKLRTLLAKPNLLQSWKQFEAQQKIYMQVFGFCLVLPIIPAGFEKYGAIEATSMWNIPPYMINIEETNKLFNQTDIAGILKWVVLDYKGEKTTLQLETLGFFKDFTPSFDTLIFPSSRTELLEEPINIVIGGLESENEIISYAGSQGLLTPDSGSGSLVAIPLSQPQKEQLQADFKRQYGIRKGQFRYIISPAAMKWQAMGTDPKKLNLVEYVEQASKLICDGHGYPPHLLGLLDPTFNNQNAAEKGLYQNTIMPESASMYEEWNNFFKLNDTDDIMVKDFSHLPVLQEDREAMGRGLSYLNQALQIQWLNNQITANEWRIKSNMETNDDPMWNEYYYQWVARGIIFGGTGAASSPPTQPDPNNPQPPKA